MSKEARGVTVIGAPIEQGASVRGALMGPAALRTAGMIDALEELSPPVRDLGDLSPRPWSGAASAVNMRNLPDIAGWSSALHEAAYDAACSGATPLILGGDHSIGFGSISGVARRAQASGRPFFVLWLDAHADFNTPATSPSGNMHGMPMAYLCGEPGFEALAGVEPPERAPIDPGNVFMLGLRSVDPQERDLLAQRGVNAYDMRRIDEDGVAAITRGILEQIRQTSAEQNAQPWLHVSLDVDFLDPEIAPGVGTTVPGGASFREAHLVMEMLHDSGLTSSVDVAELNPFLDERGKSARLLVDLVASLFGRRIFDRPTPRF